MKTKFISLAATLLLAASSFSAFAARSVYNSSLNVNGTWYNCSSNESWCDGGYFNNKDLGDITELKIGGKAYSWNNDQDWHGGVIYLGYRIDDGEDKSLSMSYIGWDEGTKGMIFQSGGEPFVSSPITEFSNLSVGAHRLVIWFYNADPNTGESGYDSNNGSNYVATFTKVNPAISISDNSTGTEVNTTLNNYLDDYVDLTLSGRTIYAGTWNTLCLPFGLDDLRGTILEGADLRKLNSASFNEDDGSLTLNFVKQQVGMDPEVSYLVKLPEGANDIPNPEFKNVQILSASPKYQSFSSSTDDALFMGCYGSTTISGNQYLYLGEGNTLYWPDPSVTIGAFRGYFELAPGITAGEPLPGEQGIKSFVLNFGDDNETTSIKTISESSDHSKRSDVYFTLDGRRLNDKPATAGLYIINGKKVVIK